MKESSRVLPNKLQETGGWSGARAYDLLSGRHLAGGILDGSAGKGEGTPRHGARDAWARERKPRFIWRRRWLALSAALCLTAAAATSADTPGTGWEAASSLLQLFDGSVLHGQLESVDPLQGIYWRHPAAAKPLEFQPRSIYSIRFEGTKPVTPKPRPNCRLEFANGDEIYGTLTSLENEGVRLDTWFGGGLTAQRSELTSITFLSKEFTVLYEGPTGFKGWDTGRAPGDWEYEDGTFVTSSAGSIGRDLKLTGHSSFSFDLAWKGSLNLLLALGTDSFHQLGFRSSTYMFYIGSGYVTLQKVQTGRGVTSVGQVLLPDMAKQNRVHLEFRLDEPDGAVELRANGKLAHRWVDGNGFRPAGTGVLFSVQRGGSALKISNLRAVAYGRSFVAQAPAADQRAQDWVYLVNGDKVQGVLLGIHGQKLKVSLPQLTLDIPLERVARVYLARSKQPAPPDDPWQIRAEISGGGAVSFRLREWTAHKVAGVSRNFGRVSFNPRSIRQIRFNLGRKQKVPLVSGGEAP